MSQNANSKSQTWETVLLESLSLRSSGEAGLVEAFRGVFVLLIFPMFSF